MLGLSWFWFSRSAGLRGFTAFRHTPSFCDLYPCFMLRYISFLLLSLPLAIASGHGSLAFVPFYESLGSRPLDSFLCFIHSPYREWLGVANLGMGRTLKERCLGGEMGRGCKWGHGVGWWRVGFVQITVVLPLQRVSTQTYKKGWRRLWKELWFVKEIRKERFYGCSYRSWTTH